MKQWNYLVAQKKLIGKTKNGENVPYFKVVDVVGQYQQKSEVLYTFTSIKPYVYLLNVVPSHLVILKTYNTQFDQFIITFTD